MSQSKQSPRDVADLDADRTLWTVGSTFGQERRVHLTADCERLSGHSTAESTARVEHNSTPVCQVCAGSATTAGGSGPDLATQIQGVWADD